MCSMQLVCIEHSLLLLLLLAAAPGALLSARQVAQNHELPQTDNSSSFSTASSASQKCAHDAVQSFEA